MTNPIVEFKEEVIARVESNSNNVALLKSAQQFNSESNSAQYSYNFSWMAGQLSNTLKT